MRVSRMELPHTALPLTVPIQTPLPQSHNVHADTLKGLIGRNGRMPRSAARAMQALGVPERRGKGPSLCGGGGGCISADDADAEAGKGNPRRTGNVIVARGRAPQGAPQYSAGCFHAHVMDRMGVRKTFTPQGAMRRGATGAGKGPRTSHPEPREAERTRAMPERKREAPRPTAGGARRRRPHASTIEQCLLHPRRGRDPTRHYPSRSLRRKAAHRRGQTQRSLSFFHHH